MKTMSDEEIQELVKKSPYYKATSNDIDWVNKVKMQGAIQKWVDHSISVTVNLPEHVTKDVVANVYKTAWESGCKGITVYREGSRSGVLISNKDKEKQKNMGYAPKRPKVLEADVVRFKNMNNDINEDWIAFIGLLDGRPYEIFTGKMEDDIFYIPKSVKKVNIIKHKHEDGTKRYDFYYFDKQGYKVTFEGLNRWFSEEYWNYAKLVSGVLRHGMPIPNVINLVSSLRLDSEAINTWKNGVARALKRYIQDGTKAKKGIKCDNCGEEELVYQEGCLICQSCGYSKCD
ncbi:MAG: hypothetical protein Kow0068_07440 [Marinilabiliales bacterium]